MMFRLIPITLLLLFVAACDSGDPIDEPRPADVAGTYGFDELRFVPSASATQPADVLASLDSARTGLDLSTGGNFILRYQFTGESQFFAAGDFEVRATSVRIRGDADRQADFQSLLLDHEFTLNRDPDDPNLLDAAIEKTVNLEAFDRDQYRGLTSVPGILHIRLIRQP